MEKPVILLADLRDSTNTLLNFEKGLYPGNENNQDTDFTYEYFLRDVHESAYKKLYLSHENTFAEIYGDGIMAVFPKTTANTYLKTSIA